MFGRLCNFLVKKRGISKMKKPEGKYFEEVNIGDKFVTPRRTITEADIVLYAGLSGDYSLPHTDEEFCKKTPFKTRMAHGILTLAITSGLWVRLRIFEGTGLANLGQTIRFTAPVYPGDTIYADIEIIKKKEMGKGRGAITLKADTKNQDGKEVMTQEWNIMVACKKE